MGPLNEDSMSFLLDETKISCDQMSYELFVRHNWPKLQNFVVLQKLPVPMYEYLHEQLLSFYHIETNKEFFDLIKLHLPKTGRLGKMDKHRGANNINRQVRAIMSRLINVPEFLIEHDLV